MDERAQAILEAAVQGFIKNGDPVSSDWLYDNYDFGIKPARIRSELNALMETGYLDQPHTSGGRVPTDKGYRFFAERIVLRDNATGVFRERLRETFGDDFDLKSLVENLDSFLPGLRMGWQRDGGEFHKAGLDELFSELSKDAETWSLKAVQSVLKDLESAEEKIDLIDEAMEKDDFRLKVFIGEENPILRNDQLSAIGICGGEGMPIDLFLIGPKRMDYKKNIALMKELQNIINDAGHR